MHNMFEADLQLTTTHGFFMIMGGFHYFKPYGGTGNSHEMTDLPLEAPLLHATSNSELIEAEASPVHPLTHENITSMVRKKQIILPTEIEIQDRSKSDWLAKTIILTQTLWFMAQCIARAIERLPTTELEIVTLAYIAINFGTSIAWWNKPRNINYPIQVFKEPLEPDTASQGGWADKIFFFITGTQDEHVNLHHQKKVPVFYSGKPTTTEVIVGSDVITLVAGVIFGAVHCIAWSFEFSSSTQALLWRLSSVTITSVPFILIVSFIVMLYQDEQDNMRANLLMFLSFSIMLLSGIMYVACRFITLVIALLSLSSLPQGALQAVYWTTLIPHI